MSELKDQSASQSVDVKQHDHGGVKQWTPTQVGAWVKQVGFGDFAEQFIANGVNGTILTTLTEQEMAEDLKLPALPRRRLMAELSRFTQSRPSHSEHESREIPQAEDSGIAALEDHDPDMELQLNSVVKIFCTSTTPNYAQPWQMQRQRPSTSSGFAISGRRILCNAHGVTNSTAVRVRRHGDATKYPAKVAVVGHECDLAILTVESEAFWNGLQPLAFGKVPRLQEHIVVVGYPTGGDNISVTKGVVSRVVVATYSHSGESLLTLQTDSAINPGNSGGPAMQGKLVVGVAFETLTKAQNIGYIIPVPVIEHFLEDIDRHGKYTGFPMIGFDWQSSLENPGFRQYLKVPEDKNGVVVTFVQPLADAATVLKKYDVITAIDGVAVGDDGTTFFRRGERVAFKHVVSRKFISDSVTLSLIREGKELDVTVKLMDKLTLVPKHLHDKLPSYFVFAGLVFTVLSRAYLYHEWGKEWPRKASVNLVRLTYDGVKDFQEQQKVVMSQVLVDDVNVGYNQNLHALIVEAVNDEPVRNLRHLVDLVESAVEQKVEFIRFNLDNDKVMVINIASALSAEERILSANHILSSKSSDLGSSPSPIPSSTPGSVATTPTASAASRTLPAKGETRHGSPSRRAGAGISSPSSPRAARAKLVPPSPQSGTAPSIVSPKEQDQHQTDAADLTPPAAAAAAAAASSLPPTATELLPPAPTNVAVAP